MIAGTIAVVLGTIAIGMLLTRKKQLVPRPEELTVPPKRRPSHGAGEAPATAIRAGGEQLARLRTTQRCRACRSVMTPGSDERVRYGDGELLVIELRCGRCEARRALYVQPSAATPTTA